MATIAWRCCKHELALLLLLLFVAAQHGIGEMGSCAQTGVCSTTMPSEVEKDLALELRMLLRCSELCNQGPSDEDERLAKMFKSPASTVCSNRCRRNDKTVEESSSVPPVEEYRELPANLLDYRRTASQCIAAGLRPWEDILHGLESCGVAHLSGQLLPSGLLSEVRSAYKDLHGSELEMAFRLDQSQLRAGREEMWLPFRWPFNSSAMLSMPQLLQVVQLYLGPNATFDHITVLDAPAATATKAQALHADVSHARQHLEVHVPLEDVTVAMGATTFCPGSHGISEVDDLRRAYFKFANCSYDPALSYTQPLRAGQVTIYDGNVFHFGSANTAGVDRPILALSWAADATLVKSRNYAQRTFAKNSTRWQLIQPDIDAFRIALRQET